MLPGTLLDAPPGTNWSEDDVVAASTALSALGGAHLAGHTMERMSNGEGQRVRLARALDALDPDKPVLLVAKGDSRAAAAADRVLVLDAGRRQTRQTRERLRPSSA